MDSSSAAISVTARPAPPFQHLSGWPSGERHARILPVDTLPAQEPSDRLRSTLPLGLLTKEQSPAPACAASGRRPTVHDQIRPYGLERAPGTTTRGAQCQNRSAISITAVTNAITEAANVTQLNRASLTAALSRRSTPYMLLLYN